MPEEHLRSLMAHLRRQPEKVYAAADQACGERVPGLIGIAIPDTGFPKRWHPGLFPDGIRAGPWLACLWILKDTTVLHETEQEQTNGLAAPAEMSITRNWVGDEAAQEALQTAYENDELRALRVIFPSGNGFYVLVEVRQSSWSAATSSVVGATYSLRVRGKPKRIYASGS